MREELDALIGVGWGESSPKRKGYRNGSYTRDLVTASGRIEETRCFCAQAATQGRSFPEFTVCSGDGLCELGVYLDGLSA